MKAMTWWRSACVSGTLLAALPALAHHSFASFEMDKTQTVSGTVKEFQWTNPHTWIIVLAPAADGASMEWRFEGGPPVNLTRGGWNEDTLQPGDRVTVEFHPRRDGAHGGSFQAVTLPDGRRIGQMGPPAPPGAGTPPAAPQGK
jgi:hypothetical protein